VGDGDFVVSTRARCRRPAAQCPAPAAAWVTSSRAAVPPHLAGRGQPWITHLAESAEPILWSGRPGVTARPSRDQRLCWLCKRT